MVLLGFWLVWCYIINAFEIASNVLCVNPFHHQMVRFVWGCFNRCEKWSWLDCLSFCSNRCFLLTLYCHQMVRFVWGCFYQPELCPKMVAHVLIVCEKSKTFKVWHSFVTKHYRQNMFIASKAINIIWFQSLAVFWKKSFLTHWSPVPRYIRGCCQC